MIRVYEAKRINPFSDYIGSKNSDYNDLDRLAKKYNRTGDIVYMSPSDYFEMCAEMFRETQNPNSSVESLKKQRGEYDRKLIDEYTEAMKNGDKFPIPYIDFESGSQEGLHRMYCIGELYGWDTEVPVFVAEVLDREWEDRTEAIRIMDNLRYEVKEYSSDCNIDKAIGSIAGKYIYEFTDSCPDEILDAFEEGCRKERIDVVADIKTDVDSDTIEIYVVKVKYTNRKRWFDVPSEYQLVFEGKLSDYFNGINDDEDEEDYEDKDLTSDFDRIADKFDDEDWEEFNKIGLDDRSIDKFINKMKIKHGELDLDDIDLDDELLI